MDLWKAKGPWRNAELGDEAVLMCGGNVERRTIRAVHRGGLEEILARLDYRRILPTSKDVEDAMRSIREIYPEEMEFLAFELESKRHL